MKKLYIFIVLIALYSCDNSKTYKTITLSELKEWEAKDTLVENSRVLVTKIEHFNSNKYPRLLVKRKRAFSSDYFLFDYECELQNDSTMLYYSQPFVVDENSSTNENGVWFYAKFLKEGNFPFTSNIIQFSVDSLPKKKTEPLPKEEGIYFYENNNLMKISAEQSDAKFKEKEKTGFYFIPNRGRLFDKININKL